jgi:rhomboid protease GluP
MQTPSQYQSYPESQPPQPGIPVKVRLPAQKPVVTYVLIGVTVFIYLLQYLSQSFSSGGYDWPFLLGGKINELILMGQVWRLVTPVLLHGSVLHIAFNMYALYSLGNSMERYYGHGRFLLLYIIGAFCGNTLSFVLSPSASLGASTAIFALVAAEGVFIYRNRSMFGTRARSMLSNLVLIVVVNLVIGLQPGIDNWGHLGGLAGGVLFAWFAGPVLQVQTTYSGYELTDTRTKKNTLIGTLMSGGLFLAVVIGRFLAAS